MRCFIVIALLCCASVLQAAVESEDLRGGAAVLIRTNGATVLQISPTNGALVTFPLQPSEVMSPALAAKYAGIRTWIGQSAENPALHVRCDESPYGLQVQLFTPEGAVYIDQPNGFGAPANRGTLAEKRSSQEFTCLTETVSFATDSDPKKDPDHFHQIRTFRLAVAAAGEYTAFHGGTVASAMAAIVTVVNRVNGIYERELGVRLVLVPQTDQVIFTNAATDPFTGNYPIDQAQQAFDQYVGTANYDLGILFNTGTYGLAHLGTVCHPSQKGSSCMGLPEPVGEFFMTYVAHEMAHQFGANHSFNTVQGPCGANRNSATAVEPGTGSTLLSYAGLPCANDSWQPLMSDYFHADSLRQVRAFLAGIVCGQTTTTSNHAPSVTIDAEFVIPKKTPFTLRAQGTDPDGDRLYYTWEQLDLGPPKSLSDPDNGLSPLFRSFPPHTNDTRVFPKLDALLQNVPSIGEQLPETNRALHFRVTVRDSQNMGAMGFADTHVHVHTNGPFRITSHNTNGTFVGSQLITWDVAETTNAVFHTTQVNLLLSTNGGATFNVTLATNTPNDGLQLVTFPSINCENARLKIQPTGHIFFDINDANFSITNYIAPGEDVEQYGVLKGQIFTQTNSSFPVIDVSGFVFRAFADPTGIGPAESLRGVTLRLPNNTSVPVPGDDSFELGASFNSFSALNTAYQDGTYAVITEGVHDGFRTNVLNLVGSNYPSTPRFSNFSAAQSVDPRADFILSWAPISGGTTNDVITVRITGCGNDEEGIFETPGIGKPGALNGLATSVTIRARTLRPGQTYAARLVIVRPTMLDTQSYPGATGLAAYFKQVQMPLVTAGQQTGCSPGTFQLAFNFPQGHFGVGTNGIIQFPQALSYYFANFSIQDSNYPAAVTFSGPIGSGLNNTTNAQAGSSPASGFYSSSAINTPFPPGGVYTVNYKGTDFSWNLFDPNAANQQVLLVPSVVVDASNILRQVHWTYKNTNGNSIPAQPFMKSIGLHIAATGGGYDVSADQRITPNHTNHILTSTVIWTNVSTMAIDFDDADGNRYSSHWQKSSVPPAITTTNLPNGTVGTPYSFLLSAIGGTEQFAWTIESGSLPGGLSLTAGTGTIVGTPTNVGTNALVIRVTDTASTSATREFSLAINPIPLPPSFSSASRLLNGDFEMLLSGEIGKTYRIEGSTNFTDWSDLLTTGSNPTNGTVYFRDTNAVGMDRRFYRAVLVP